MKILVTDAGTNHALVLTRSLGSRGIEVTACDDNRFAKSFYSRFCTDCFVYPSPRISASNFVNSIIDRLNRGRYSVVFPMTERAILPLSEHRKRIRPSVSLPIPSHDSIMKAFDKSAVLDLAVQLQIPVPKTIKVNSSEQLAVAANELGFPMVMKSSTSEQTTNDDRIVATPKPRYVFRASPSYLCSQSVTPATRLAARVTYSGWLKCVIGGTCCVARFPPLQTTQFR